MRSILAHPLLKNINIKIISQLLVDKTTGGNIIWGTDNYESLGDKFKFDQPITIDLLTGKKALKLRARVHKSNDTKKKRTKGLAEVYTPSWVCNFQNSKVDEIWFEKENVFNKPIHKTSWVVNKNPIEFSGKKTWEKYVLLKGIEITCGEAPYMVSRYDTTTGKFIDVHRRIGFLDKKLRVINENVHDEETWFKWVLKAYESSYGYEYQGDSLFIARVNLLLTFIENFKFKWNREPSTTQLRNISNVISWNVWQMDGLTDSLISDKTIPCIIRSWRQKKNICFKEIKKGEKGTMKFDFCIGNPPYQTESEGTKALAPSIYNYFMDAVYEIGDRALLITPARFLFNTGNTSKDWNKKMLGNEHLKVVLFEMSSKKIFPNTDIKGGVAITYFDRFNKIGPIGMFVADQTLREILLKVKSFREDSIAKEICTSSKWNLEGLYSENPDYRKYIKDNGNHSQMDASAFSKVPVFFEEKPDDNEEYVQLYGRLNDSRTYRYVKRKYIKDSGNLDKYKVFVPKANGSGAIGEVLSTPVIGTPVIGSTQTFLAVGKFATEKEANACLKYLKCKFARAMLGTLKVTQNNPPSVWENVPMQNFAEDSDIDWCKSISEIDQQLYKKYGLTQKEIDFIETKVRSMDVDNIEEDGED